MSAAKRVLHLVRSAAWPADLEEAGSSETVAFLGEAPADRDGGEARIIGRVDDPAALLRLVFEHDVVITW